MTERQKWFMQAKLRIAISRRAEAIRSENWIEVYGLNSIISRTVTGLAQNKFM